MQYSDLMSFRWGDGWNYCDFARAFAKYPLAGFFGTGLNTLLGQMVPGPFAGTSGIRITRADPIYQFTTELDRQKTWIASMWIKPAAITSNKSFLLFQSRVVPNLGTQFVLQVTPAGRIRIGTGAGLNVFVFPGSYATIGGVSQGIDQTGSTVLPVGQWAHICVKVTFGPLTGAGSPGHATLWVNGNVEIDVDGTTNATSDQFANRIVPMWQGTEAIELSQFFVCDLSGGVNNQKIDPKTRVSTLFPVSDGPLRGWTPLPAWSKVNENPGPDGDGSFVTMTSLLFADANFGFPPLGGIQTNLAVLANFALKGSGQTVAGIVSPSGGSLTPFGSLTIPTPPPIAYTTLQAISELNPHTGQAWTDPEIGAAAWGIRGLTGSGQRLSQVCLEKVWRTGIGGYGY